jgi:hypothetical protein
MTEARKTLLLCLFVLAAMAVAIVLIRVFDVEFGPGCR